MHLVPTELVTSELSIAAMDAPVGFLEALQEHLYTGDVMQVAGVLEIAGHCLPDASTIDDELGAMFCMPHALPMTLVNAQYQVTEQVSPSDQCAQMDLNEIYDQAIYLDRRLVCSEGQLVETDGAYSLIPTNSTPDDFEIPLEVTSSYAGVETMGLAGQNVSVVGWIASDFFCDRWIDEEPQPNRQPTDDCELDVGSFTILLAEVSAIE